MLRGQRKDCRCIRCHTALSVNFGNGGATFPMHLKGGLIKHSYIVVYCYKHSLHVHRHWSNAGFPHFVFIFLRHPVPFRLTPQLPLFRAPPRICISCTFILQLHISLLICYSSLPVSLNIYKFIFTNNVRSMLICLYISIDIDRCSCRYNICSYEVEMHFL